MKDLDAFLDRTGPVVLRRRGGKGAADGMVRVTGTGGRENNTIHDLGEGAKSDRVKRQKRLPSPPKRRAVGERG